MSNIKNAIRKISYHDDPRIWRELKKSPISVPMEEEEKPQIEKDMDEFQKTHNIPQAKINKKPMH